MVGEVNKIIAENIKVRRLKLGYNQTEVAQRMVNPVTQQMLRKYEKGNSRISCETLCDLAQVLECTPSSLLVRYEDDRDSASLKREGRLVQYFRAITTHEGQMNLIRLAKAAANIFDQDEEFAS